jgi:hypothetical protein
MITPFWVHIIHNILITDADTFSPFKQNSIYEDLLIALQSPMIPMQPASTMMTTPTSGPSDKLARITSTLFLDTAYMATMKADPSVILTIDEDITEYYRELKLIIDLQKEVEVICTNNTDYTCHVVSLEDDLKTTNKTI